MAKLEFISFWWCRPIGNILTNFLWHLGIHSQFSYFALYCLSLCPNTLTSFLFKQTKEKHDMLQFCFLTAKWYVQIQTSSRLFMWTSFSCLKCKFVVYQNVYFFSCIICCDWRYISQHNVSLFWFIITWIRDIVL